MIFINPHKCCTFVTEKSCLTSNANLCIIQKLKLLPSHYLYWGETLVNRSFLAIRHILAEFFGKNIIFAASHLKGEKYGRDYHWQTSRAVLLEKHLRFFIHVFLLCFSSQCTGTNTCIIWQTKPLLLLTRMKSVIPPRERISCKNLMVASSGSKFVNTPPPSWCWRIS